MGWQGAGGGGVWRGGVVMAGGKQDGEGGERNAGRNVSLGKPLWRWFNSRELRQRQRHKQTQREKHKGLTLVTPSMLRVNVQRFV